MNHIYRSIWNQATGAYSAVSENVKGCGKRSLPGSGGAVVQFALKALAASMMLGFGSLALAGPTGGVVVAGQASVKGAPGAIVIQQGSQNAVINWNNFNIAHGESVTFQQPNSASVALNRVLGGDATAIMGNLSANGKVFLVNPNGVLFGKGASVNVGGLVASTLDMSNADFMAGNYKFSGNGSGKVLNQGTISAPGGYVALLGANVSNEGTIQARLGSVALAAGTAITLDVAGDGLLNVTVDKGAVGALVNNGGLIQADGGTVLLTAQAAGDLLKTVVNNTGIIEAHTIDTRGGSIKLLGDMQSGTVNAAGTLDASAPATGNGGFVETSAAHVKFDDALKVTTASTNGLTGTWLIDPTDYTIAASGGDQTGAFYTNALKSTSVQIQSISGGGGTLGDINVNDTISWSANQLKMTAQNNININQPLRGSGTASLALEYGQKAVASGNTATYNVKAEVDLPGGNNFSTRLGSDGAVVGYLVINSLGTASSNSGTDLQGIKGATSLNYVLGSNIDASSTASWNSNLGFAPIGNATTAFTGKFDGLGHAISGLAMARISQQTGLFGEIGVSGSVRNVNLIGASVSLSDPLSSAFGVGLLAARNKGLIDNVNVAGVLTARGPVFGGGMAGQNFGTINNSVTSGTFNYLTGFGAGYGGGGLVNRNQAGAVISNSSSSMTVGSFDGATGLATNAVSGMGGLAFYNAGLITNSFATGAVRGGGVVGGLVAYGSGVGVITGSFATGAVSGSGSVGGLVGINAGTVRNSYANGDVAINEAVGAKAGGLVGDNRNSSGNISNSYATGNVSGYRSVGGVVGSNTVATISNVYSTGTVTETDPTYHHSGGVVGENINGTVSNGYYNATANAGLAGVGFASGIGTGLTGATGLSATQMRTVTNFAGFNFAGVTPGASGNNWVMVDVDGTLNNAGGAPGATTPMLASEYSNKIYSAHQLQLMAMDTAANYTLAADINAATTGTRSDVWSGGTFLPVGRDLNNPFTGSLDGVGHTIYGLVVNRPNDSYSGLFGATSGTAIVRNIGLEGGSVTGFNSTGALVGANLGLVDSSYSTVNVTGRGSQIGGLVGLNGTTNGVPGIVSNSYASGAVTGTGIVGGLAGLNSGTLTNNYASGAVTGGNTRGGVAGASNGTASGNFWDTTLSGMATSGAGIGLTTAQMKTLANFSGAGWDLAGKWISYDGNSAPLLRAFMTPLQVNFASNDSKTYDGTSTWTRPAVTNSNAYAYALLSGSLNYGAAGNAVNAGTYAITAGGLYSGQHGYAIDVNAATLTIAPTALTVTGMTTVAKTYDGNTKASLSGGVLTGLVAGETLGFSGQSGVYADKNAASGKAVTVTGVTLVTGTGLASNYTVSNPTGLTGTVNKATITGVGGLTASNKVYNGDGVAIIGGAAVINGMIAGDNVVLTSANGTFSDRNAGVNKIVSISGITLGGGDFVNYSFSNTSGATTATITPKALTVTGLAAGNKVYDGNVVATLTGGALAGLVGTETLNLVGQSGAFGDQNAGTGKVVTVTGSVLTDAGSGATAGRASNYTVSNASGLTANITPKALTVTGVTAFDKTYDGSTLATLSGGILGGLVGSETLNLVGQSGAFGDQNAGSGKAVTVTGSALANAGSGVTAGLASNYTVANATGVTANIAQKALTVTGMTTIAKTYDGNTNASLSGGVLAGLVAGETLGFSGQSGVFADKNAGSGKAVTVTGVTLGTGTGLASNYTVSNPTGVTGTVNKATITGVGGLTASNKVYDGDGVAIIGGAAVINGMIAGDNVVLTSANGTFSDRNAGVNKTVSISGITLGGGDLVNYSFSNTSGATTATITPKALTVTGLAAGNKVYDGNVVAALTGGVLDGLVGTETLNLVGQSGAFGDQNAGTGKAVTVTGAALTNGGSGATAGVASNYTVANATGVTATIAQKALTVAGMTTIAKTYDGNTNASLSGGVLAGLVAGETLGFSGQSGIFADKNAGSGKAVTVTGVTLGTGTGLASNYTVSNPTGLTGTVNKATITGVGGLTASNKVYDGDGVAIVGGAAVINGMIAGDNVVLTSANGTFSDRNAGVNKIVSISGITLGGGDLVNYSFSNTSAATTATITPKALTVTGLAAGNKVYDGNVVAALTGGVLDGLVGTETLNLVGQSGAFGDQNAGSGKVVTVTGSALTDAGSGATAGRAGNYMVSNASGLTANITPKALTVTGVTAFDKTYDGATLAILSGGILGGLVGSETLSLVGQSGAFGDQNAGTGKVVTVTGSALTDAGSGATAGRASNYTVSNASGLTANITPKALTVTGVTAFDKTYDGSTLATLSGGILGGLVGSETLNLVGQSGAFGDQNAGAGKAVTVTGSALANAGSGATAGLASNYTVANATGVTATIAQKALTVTGMTAGAKVYDGNTKASLSGGVLAGLVVGETLGFSGQSGVFADKNAASGKAVTVTGVILGTGTGLASNYTVSNPTGVAASITQKALTVTGITAANKVYDGNTGATVGTAGATFGGMVGGDTLTLSAGGAFSDKNANAGKTVAISGIALGGVDAGNYSLASTTASATADITKATIGNVSGILADSKVYNGATTATLSATGATFNGIVAGDALSFNATRADFSDKNVGTGKSVAVGGITLGGVDAGNYLLASSNGTGFGNITAATISNISGILADSKVYNGATTATLSATGATFNGMVAGDALSFNAARADFNDKNVGTGKSVAVGGITLGGADAGNYVLASSNGTSFGNITAATISSVSGITAGSKAYDGKTDAALDTSGALFAGMVADDKLTVSGASGAFSDKNASNNKTINVSGIALAGADAGNYVLDSKTGTATANITAKALTVTGMLAGNKTYDGTAVAQVSGGTLSGLVGAETLGLSGQTGMFSDKNAANGKVVTVTGATLQDGTGLASNYSITNPTGLTASITQKALTISGQLVGDKVYDGNTTATLSGGTLSGLVGAETLAIGGQKATFADKNAANGKTVTVSGATLLDTANGMASNYTVSNPTVLTASISRAVIDGVTGIAAGNKVYDGTTLVSLNTNNVGFTGSVAGDQLGVATAFGVFANKNAGAGKAVNVSGISLNGVDAGNYTLANTSAAAAANIAQAQLAVTASGINKVYDATTGATVVLADNRIAGDVLSVSSGAASFANKNAGSGKTVTVGGIALAGADAGNYAFNTTAATTATITQAALGIKVNDAVKNQGQVNPVFSATYSGFLGSDTVGSDVTGTLAFGTQATTGSPAATYQVVASGQASSNYAISYAPGALTVNAVAPPVVIPPVVIPPAVPPALAGAAQDAVADVIAMAAVEPLQGNLVHAGLIIDNGVPESGEGDDKESESVKQVRNLPALQVNDGTTRGALSGLKLSIIDRGIRLPAELSGTPAFGGSE